jgi:hypothetical protein
MCTFWAFWCSLMINDTLNLRYMSIRMYTLHSCNSCQGPPCLFNTVLYTALTETYKHHACESFLPLSLEFLSSISYPKSQYWNIQNYNFARFLLVWISLPRRKVRTFTEENMWNEGREILNSRMKETMRIWVIKSRKIGMGVHAARMR